MKTMALLAVLFLFSAVGVTYASTHIVEQQIGLNGSPIKSRSLVPDKKPAQKKSKSQKTRSAHRREKPAKGVGPAPAEAAVPESSKPSYSPPEASKPSYSPPDRNTSGEEAEEEEAEDDGYDHEDDDD